jgi:spermidine synthase
LKSRNDSAVAAAIVATGISSVATQLVLIREFLAQFQGNEIVIALILFTWLVLGGIGALSARAAAGARRAHTWHALGSACLALPVLALGAVFGARLLRDVVFTRGASVGFYQSFGFIFALTAPYALLLGFVLPFSLFVLKARDPAYPGAQVLVLDNLGDILGGALFSLLLLVLVSPLKALMIANLPLIGVLVLMNPPLAAGRSTVRIGAGLVLALLAWAVFFETASLRPSSGTLVDYRETPYGRLTVVREGQSAGPEFTLFADGAPHASSRDPAAAEESVHYPLAQLEKPRQVLLVSAQAGMLAELAKYGLESIDYVELDPQVSKLLFEYDLLQPIAGLNAIHRDGRAWLAESRKTYDAIVVSLHEPETFQVNRFFTGRFFALARSHLVPQGVLSFQMEGFDNYLPEPQRQKLSSLYNTARRYFPQVLLLPGQNVVFLCRAAPIRSDIPAALAERGIASAYIGAYFDGNVTAERIRRLNALIDPHTPPNTDLSPFLMQIMFSQWFSKFGNTPAAFIAILAGLCAVYLWRIRRVEFILFSTGWTTMGCEILVIFAFQIFFGYIYLQIGLIVTVFLAGILPGAWFGRRLVHHARRVLALADAALIFLLAGLALAVGLGDRLPLAAFLFLGFAVSTACGLQIPAALHLLGGGGSAATRIFSADLIGAAFGTLAVSCVMLPYLGIHGCLAALTGVKLISLFTARFIHDTHHAQTVPS